MRRIIQECTLRTFTFIRVRAGFCAKEMSSRLNVFEQQSPDVPLQDPEFDASSQQPAYDERSAQHRHRQQGARQPPEHKYTL